MTDTTILLTGATDGIGRITALKLAATKATLLLHGRSPGKVDDVVSAARDIAGHDQVRGYVADFAELADVTSLADQITSNHDRLDGLINNAGIGSGGMHNVYRDLSNDGHELRFQVNYLAPVLLTRRLLPLLIASAPSRIVNVSSLGQQPLAFDDLMLEDGFDGRRAYRQSKLAMVMFSFDLARELSDTGVTVNALHPGSLLNTKMVRDTFNEVWGEPEEGADAEVALMTARAYDGVSGEFFDGTDETRANDQAYDAGAREQLRQATVRLLGDHLTVERTA